MWKTILRRVLIMIPQLFVLSLIVFILAKFMPGDPFSGLITPETDPLRLEELREKAGLNDPWYEQYARWVVFAGAPDPGLITLPAIIWKASHIVFIFRKLGASKEKLKHNLIAPRWTEQSAQRGAFLIVEKQSCGSPSKFSFSGKGV